MGIKCQISVDQTVFSYNKIHQSHLQVKSNSLNEVIDKINSKASVNLIQMEASIMPNGAGEAKKPCCFRILWVFAPRPLFSQIGFQKMSLSTMFIGG